jgi:hypothetical protein
MPEGKKLILDKNIQNIYLKNAKEKSFFKLSMKN